MKNLFQKDIIGTLLKIDMINTSLSLFHKPSVKTMKIGHKLFIMSALILNLLRNSFVINSDSRFSLFISPNMYKIWKILLCLFEWSKETRFCFFVEKKIEKSTLFFRINSLYLRLIDHHWNNLTGKVLTWNTTTTFLTEYMICKSSL